MTTPIMPICESCVRLAPNLKDIGFVCAAFPDGIPDAIYLDGFDHRQPFPGDSGVLYEMSAEPGAAARLKAYEAAK